MLLVFCSLISIGYSQLEYVQSSRYNLIWRSPGSSAGVVSLWQPVIPEEGYYRLGDVMTQGADSPSTSSLLIKPARASDVSVPVRSKAIWTADVDYEVITIFKLFPKSGHRCLGMVAVRGSSPDLSRYRCVKKTYLRKGSPKVWWNALDTNLRYRQIYFHHVQPDSTGENVGLPMDHFYVSSKQRNNSPFFVLDTEFIQPRGLDPGYGAGIPEAVTSQLSVVLSPSLNPVWIEGRDYKIYNPEPRSFYHAIASSLDEHSTYLVSGQMNVDIARPTTYTRVYTRESEGVSVFFWKPSCPEGFRSPGLYATNSRPTEPTDDGVVCIADHYMTTENGYWEYISTDEAFENTLWASGNSKENVLDLAAFTHTPSLANPYNNYRPSFLVSDLINQGDQSAVNDVVTMTQVRFGEASRVLSRRDLLDGENTDINRNDVTAAWMIPALSEEDAEQTISIQVNSDALNGLSDNIRKLITQSADMAVQLDSYFSFSMDASKNRGSGDRWSYLVTETWLELPFTGFLAFGWSDTADGISSGSRVSGRLYVVVTEAPLWDKEDMPESMRIESTKETESLPNGDRGGETREGRREKRRRD